MSKVLPVIVSLTPTAAIDDTRTLKIARTFSSLGYRSIVVENKRGSIKASLKNVEIITLPDNFMRGFIKDKKGAVSPRSNSQQSVFQPVKEVMHYFRFILSYFIVRPLQGAAYLKNADVIYLHEYRLYPMVALARFLGNKAPLIYDAHDFYPNVYEVSKLSGFWRYVFLPMLIRIEKNCIRAAEQTVVVSEGVAALYKLHAGIDAVVIRNSHDPMLDSCHRVDIRSLVGLSDDDFILVCVGNRKPGLAVEPLVDALTDLPNNVHIIFVGDEHEWSARYARQRGVSSRVHTPGRMPSGDIVNMIKTADTAVIPYHPETENVRAILPNGFFQSIASGRPLIYANLPDIKTLIGDRIVGIEVNPIRREEIIGAVIKLKNDHAFAESCAKSTQSLSKDVGWPMEVSKLHELVDMVYRNNSRESYDEL